MKGGLINGGDKDPLCLTTSLSDMREEEGLQVKVKELSRQCRTEEAGRGAGRNQVRMRRQS